MSPPWFETESTGTLTVSHEDDSWIVTDPAVDTRTVCFFDDEAPDPDSDPVTVEVHIDTRRLTASGDTNYLTVTRSTDDTAGGETATAATFSKYPEQSLQQFDGSGEYVTIEATIAGIEYVKKEADSMPDVKGVLKEVGSTRRLPFVVEDGAGHPYFETGSKFRFVGVKDHRYEKQNEVQALVTKETKITEL